MGLKGREHSPLFCLQDTNEERSYKLDLYKSEKRLAYNNKKRPEHAQKNEHALYIVTKPATDHVEANKLNMFE